MRGQRLIIKCKYKKTKKRRKKYFIIDSKDGDLIMTKLKKINKKKIEPVIVAIMWEEL